MTRWFRFYGEAINDPKILRLSDAMFRAWMTLLCIASKYDGVLPATSDVALMLRIKPAKVAEWIAVLTAAGLIDRTETGFMPHNWNARQFKSDVSNERVKRHRNGVRNVTSAVTVTPPDTEQIQKQISCPEPKPVRTKREYSDEFEAKFWGPYPRSPTMSKKEAWREWVKLTPEQRLASCQAIEPYRRHLRSKPNLETVHACRFLSQQRFEGFSAQASQPMHDIRSNLV